MTKSLGCILLGLLTLSCTTTSDLWEATDPRAFVLVPKADITEAKLQARGLRYYADARREDVWYVEKSLLHKTRDYTYRALGTPVTVVIDVVPPLVLVGAMVIMASYIPPGNVVFSSDHDAQRRQEEKWDSLSRTVDDLRAEEQQRHSGARDRRP